MKAVRLLFAALVPLMGTAFGSPAAVADVDFSVCCTGSACSGGGNRTAFHANKTFDGNRTAFDAIETFGGRPCDDGVATGATPVRKCCPLNRAYDPDERTCRRAASPDDAAAGFRAHVLSLDRFRSAAAIGYNFGPPTCDNYSVLADVPADVAVRDAAAPAYCLDVQWTPSSADARPGLVARACRPRDQYCDRFACANKCCRLGKMIVAGKCQNNDEMPFRPPVHELDDSGAPVSVGRDPLPYYDRLYCFDRDVLVTGTFALLTDGSLYRTDLGERLTASKFCLEYAVSSAHDGIGQADLQAQVCLADGNPLGTDGNPLGAEDIAGSWKYIVIAAGIATSIVCLTVTLIVYASLSSLHNVHGYYVMCYVACLLLFYVFLLVIQWASTVMSAVLCELFGYLTLFAFLTTLCWLNVICFDIYCMLKYNNSINKSTSISVRTVVYNIYSWGFSSICIIIGFSFQHSGKAVLHKYAPNIGNNNKCWFIEKSNGHIIFFVVPVSTMLIVNLILFVLTTVHCSRIKSELSKFKRSDMKTRRFKVEKEKFVMSTKLFLVMGIPWSFEILYKYFNNGWLIWHILDEINTLQGVMIFVIFVAKRKVITSLRKKFNGTLDRNESTKLTISGSSNNGSILKSFNDF